MNELTILPIPGKNVTELMEETTSIFESMRNTDIVIYGAGNIGRKMLAALREDGFSPVCFSDINHKNAAKAEIPVLSPEEAAFKYKENSIFIIAVLNQNFSADYRKIKNYLESLGIHNIIHFSKVARKYPERLLPQFAQGSHTDILPYKKSIRKAAALFSDELSRVTFEELLRVSLEADYENFSPPFDGIQYFPSEVIASLPEKDIIVSDCGAYDGDTLQTFLEIVNPSRLKEWHAFEPDPVNYIKLTAYRDSLPKAVAKKVFCHPFAVGCKNCRVSFCCEGGESSKADEGNGVGTVKCISLDDFFKDKKCHLIKMDIEGYEMEALEGSETIIKKENPLLAICVYHKPQDFFTLPLKIKEMVPNKCKILLRRYRPYFFDTVVYKI